MKTRIIKFVAMAMVSAFSVQPSAFASLSAVVTPGYQFPLDGSVVPTPTLLNLLAEPTIQIYGTIGGSNTLAPGSVTGASLSDNLPDGGVLSLPLGATMGWNANSPRQLAVNCAGLVNGLGGITVNVSSNQLYLNVDTNLLALMTNSLPNTNSWTGSIYTNWLTIKPFSLTDFQISPTAGIQPFKLLDATNTFTIGGANQQGTNAWFGQEFMVVTDLAGCMLPQPTNPRPTLHLNTYTNLFNFVAAGVVGNVTHGFSNTPASVRWVAICQTADNGYLAGDEVNAEALSDDHAYGHYIAGANATNVWLVGLNTYNVIIWNKTNGASATLTTANWKFKVYARP